MNKKQLEQNRMCSRPTYMKLQSEKQTNISSTEDDKLSHSSLCQDIYTSKMGFCETHMRPVLQQFPLRREG